MVVDADVLAREVVAPGSEGLAEVARVLGPEVIAADGSLDRDAVGRLVFADDARRRALESVTHPLVAARTREIVSRAPRDAIVVHDVPLIVELNMAASYHLVLVVDAPEEVRVARLTQSRGMSEDDARARIAAQATRAQREAAADVWIDTSQPYDQVSHDVQRLWSQRLVPFEANVRARLGRRTSGPAVLRPHDPDWRRQARRLQARVAAAAGGLGRGVEHIGSTAVPGLAAKPVLDLQLAVASLTDDAERRALVERLCAAGFPGDGSWQYDRPKPVDPDPLRWRKLYHRTADPGGLPVHLHVRELGSPGWRYALLTRDWWRADAGARQDYERLKRTLAREHAHETSSAAYADAKEPWFTEAFSRAQAWATRTGWVPPDCRWSRIP